MLCEKQSPVIWKVLLTTNPLGGTHVSEHMKGSEKSRSEEAGLFNPQFPQII